MAKYEVTTESGARYLIDTELKLMRRVRPSEINLPPGVGLSLMKSDGQDLPFINIKFEVGAPLTALWNNNGRPNWRQSTYVTSVKEIDVPSAPDQPA